MLTKKNNIKKDSKKPKEKEVVKPDYSKCPSRTTYGTKETGYTYECGCGGCN